MLKRVLIIKMIVKATSCYENAKSGNLVSITGDGGNAWGFFGSSYKRMAPRLYLWKYYNENPDIEIIEEENSGDEAIEIALSSIVDNLTEDELIRWYIQEFFDLRLKELDPYMFLNDLNQKFGNEIILLCHESPGASINIKHFCHRRLIADWLELETGLIIPEISIDENGRIIKEDVYDLKPYIRKLIRK